MTCHDKRRARFGLAYHRGRPEHASRLYVARQLPEPWGPFVVAALQVEPSLQRLQRALRALEVRPCPRCGSRHPRALECPQRVAVHAWGRREPVVVHVVPDLSGIVGGLAVAQQRRRDALAMRVSR